MTCVPCSAGCGAHPYWEFDGEAAQDESMLSCSVPEMHVQVWSRLMPQLGKRKYVSLVDFFNVESTIFGAGETREAPTWAYEGHSTFAISVVDQMQWMLKSGHMEEEHVGSAVTDCLNFTHSHVFMQEEGLRKHGKSVACRAACGRGVSAWVASLPCFG